MKKYICLICISCAVLTMVACGKEETYVKNSITAVEENKEDSTDNDTSIVTNSENDLVIGSWYCDEVQECIEFTDSETVTVTTPMVNMSGTYKLEDGKLIMTFDIGDDIHEYELSDSALILKNSDGEYKFIRGTADSVTENVSTTTDAANVLSVTVYESNIADVRRQLEKRPKGSVSVYFDGTPYMLLYADLGDGLSAKLSDSTNGSILGIVDYEISDTEIVFHADMSSYKDFSFKEVSSYSEIIDYDGNGGGMITYAAADVVKYADAKASDDNKETESDSSHNENLNETQNESEVNAILSQAAGHYVQGNNLGSVDLIDNGNGTYSLQDVNIYYTEVVELGPPSKMEDKEWHGASGNFGDGKGAKSAGNGNVRVTLNLVGGNSKVVINKDGGMTIEWDGTVGPLKYDFVREY